MLPPVLPLILTLIAGYLLGATPFAVLIAKAHGVNIFKEGSGNPGATNVKRVLGTKAGYSCFALDALKGFVAAGWPALVWAGEPWAQTLAVCGLVAAILGHSFSVFIRFKGGKGVATTIGGLLAVSPIVILIGALIWVAVFYTSRYVSLASLCLGVSLPISAWALQRSPVVLWLTVVLALLIVVRHRSNIRRLLKGEEHRFGKHKQP